MAITRAQQARQMLKDGNFVMQGGVRNYLGKQKTVSDIPLKWQSGPDKPSTELAYITKAEKDLLLKKDIHGSLKDGPNKGPEGIISLDSAGDKDGPVGGYSGADVSAAESGNTPAGMDQDDADAFRGGAIAAGATPKDTDTAGAKEEAKKIQKQVAERKRKAAAAITKEEKKEARLNRKRIQQRLQKDRLARQERIEDILSGKIKNFGLTDTELADLKAAGLYDEEEGFTDPELTSSALYGGLPESVASLFEKSDKFSGAEMEAFKEKFNLPETGLLSLDAGLKLFEGPLKKGSRFTKDFFTDDVLDAGKFTYKGQTVTPEMFKFLSPTEMQEVYSDYMGRRQRDEIDAYGNPIIRRDDDGGRGSNQQLPLLPQPPVQDPTTPPIIPQFYRFMADGGMADDDLMMQGGITDLALRDEFFLGGVVKGIKKGLKGVTRAVKKIAKSPIGKAALFAGVAGIPFGGGSFFGSGSLFGKASGLLKSEGLKNFFLKDAAAGIKGGLSTKGIVTALTAAPFIGELLGLNKQKEEPLYAGPGLDFDAQQFYRLAADGGLMRQNYDAAGAVMSKEDMEKMAKSPLYKGFKTMYGVDPNMAKENKKYEGKFEQFEQLFKKGYQEGGDVEPVAKKTMPLLDMGGKEKDYRETGGFVDMGRMERADDVPARLSKNEFVFTAEAVRNAGDGDVDKGSEVMYNMMKNLESGGDVSEESQGLEGAREMFQTSKRLEEVI
jgi:hypothetical protein|tara:strand:+ start:107 stop:2278 length:2172 start_codon:yes stop_codon:yes gene_type:complete